VHDYWLAWKQGPKPKKTKIAFATSLAEQIEQSIDARADGGPPGQRHGMKPVQPSTILTWMRTWEKEAPSPT